MGERQPLNSRGGGCLQISSTSSMGDVDCGEGPASMGDGCNAPLSADQEMCSTENGALLDGDVTRKRRGGGADVFHTSLNISKMCMGTGCLALPFAAAKGGLLFNIVGLCLIALWNYYSANCLLRCIDYLPQIVAGERRGVRCEGELDKEPGYGAVECCEDGETCSANGDAARHEQLHPPPEGTTAYGAVAWYALGPKGLMLLDLLMLMLFFGLLIAYEVAMMSFINDTPLTTGSRRLDLLIPSAIVAILSCARDMSFLSKFSGIGLLAVGLSFIVIACQGFEENGLSGFRETFELNLWPKSFSAASSWFGVVVFGYGVVPFVFNFRDSMASPNHVNLALQIGLGIVYVGYVLMSNGIRVLFSPTHMFDGDVLQAMPNTAISFVVRLLMTFVVAVTAPLIVVPFGELVQEGKLGIESTIQNRIAVRVLFVIVCTLVSEFVPSGFVHVVSFIGCFCVAMVGFVLPPLFCIQLRASSAKEGQQVDSQFLYDVGILALGVVATAFTSALTFRELLVRTELEQASQR
ncbi:hypothetical protein ACHAXT_004944 [Thalassiosira profunda]